MCFVVVTRRVEGFVLSRLRERVCHVCYNRQLLRVLRGAIQRRRWVSSSAQWNHRWLWRGQTLISSACARPIVTPTVTFTDLEGHNYLIFFEKKRAIKKSYVTLITACLRLTYLADEFHRHSHASSSSSSSSFICSEATYNVSISKQVSRT